MIASDFDWENLFIINPDISILRRKVFTVLERIDCRNLSFSGGIDSTILLILMKELYDKEVVCYTTGITESHPDVVLAKSITSELNVSWKFLSIDDTVDKDGDGNWIVSQFYGNLKKCGVQEIIAGDGIDEYMGGYYKHMQDPSVGMYYYFLKDLLGGHLFPLNSNSKDVKVHLPYLFPELVVMYNNYELKNRFFIDGRKKVMVRLAEALNIPPEIINRRKYGFCDAARIKEDM